MVLLKQIANVNAGYPFRGKIPESEQGQIIVVQMKDTTSESGINWHGCIKTDLKSSPSANILRVGDILVAARGNHNYAVLIDDVVIQNKIQAVASPHFFVITVTSDSILPAYLNWFLNQQPCQRYFEQNAEGTLTKSIRRDVLAHIPIPLPTLEKQQQLVKLINNYHQQQQLLANLQANNARLLAAMANDLINDKEVLL